MQKALTLILLCFYLISLPSQSVAADSSRATTIKIIHTHAQADHHHISDEKPDHEGTDSEHSHEGATHSHEIVIGSVLFCALVSAPFKVIDFATSPTSCPERVADHAPRSPSLASIFRPPIA